MTHILVDLPEEVTAKLKDHQGAEAELQLFLAEAAKIWLRSKQEAETTGMIRSSGKRSRFADSAIPFIDKLIAENRSLFERLAKLPDDSART